MKPARTSFSTLRTTLSINNIFSLKPFLQSNAAIKDNKDNNELFSAFLEMFRNSDQFIAHMSAEYGIYVYLFLFTVYFLETGIVICALLPGDSLIFVSGAASAAGILNPLGAFLAIALGACFGNTVAYGIGYFLGSKIYDGSIKWIDQQQMAKTQAFLPNMETYYRLSSFRSDYSFLCSASGRCSKNEPT